MMESLFDTTEEKMLKVKSIVKSYFGFTILFLHSLLPTKPQDNLKKKLLEEKISINLLSSGQISIKKQEKGNSMKGDTDE